MTKILASCGSMSKFMHMARRLTAQFLEALDVALATLGDVATGMRRHYRTLQAYRRGEFEVGPRAARDLAAYLQRRARAFDRIADALRRAAQREGRKQ